MPATDKDVIKWQFKYLIEHSDDLSESELNLLISFEKQFLCNDKLSERQMEVLEDIYKRH